MIYRTGPLSTGRVETFSDGVLAVAITLLVLDMKLPSDLPSDAALWSALLHLAPAHLDMGSTYRCYCVCAVIAVSESI
jgi:hypothetical protein